MQLKRDTDYAMRIIWSVCRAKTDKDESIIISEICRQIGIARTIALRICNKLADNEIISSDTTVKNEIRFSVGEKTGEKTMYDVIKAIEGSSDLLEAFDKSFESYEKCGEVLDSLEESFNSILKQKTLGEMFGL